MYNDISEPMNKYYFITNFTLFINDYIEPMNKYFKTVCNFCVSESFSVEFFSVGLQWGCQINF